MRLVHARRPPILPTPNAWYPAISPNTTDPYPLVSPRVTSLHTVGNQAVMRLEHNGLVCFCGAVSLLVIRSAWRPWRSPCCRSSFLVLLPQASMALSKNTCSIWYTYRFNLPVSMQVFQCHAIGPIRSSGAHGPSQSNDETLGCVARGKVPCAL